MEGWFPAEFALEFGGVDGVAGIVAEAVGDVGDEVEVGAFRTTKEAVNGVDYYLYYVYVLPFVEASDVIGLGDGSFMEYEVYCPRVVFYEEPVTDILAFAIDRERFTVAILLINNGISFSGNWYGP